MSKMMYLCARTNKEGSDDEVELDITEHDFNKLSYDEQKQLIAEYQEDVVDIWTEAK